MGEQRAMRVLFLFALAFAAVALAQFNDVDELADLDTTFDDSLLGPKRSADEDGIKEVATEAENGLIDYGDLARRPKPARDSGQRHTSMQNAHQADGVPEEAESPSDSMEEEDIDIP